jgi:hypothetical protein
MILVVEIVTTPTSQQKNMEMPSMAEGESSFELVTRHPSLVTSDTARQ